ncbi:hypothetical protein EHZ19_18685 [Paraburkholderia bannensis]|nr:hypothetical protein [Paraburkholderia bannensis]RQM46543.1 hypothetical protein EHZ19_18685 [Paraburkholderia bannensis]
MANPAIERAAACYYAGGFFTPTFPPTREIVAGLDPLHACAKLGTSDHKASCAAQTTDESDDSGVSAPATDDGKKGSWWKGE